MSTLPTSKFSRGSEWRRWDLHVHTPASGMNNQFGNDWDKYVYCLFSEAIRNNIAVLGITDYFLVEGYKRLRHEYLDRPDRMREVFRDELSQDPEYLDKIQQILILPNIEFRIHAFFEKGDDCRRLTMHVIFSDEVEIGEIEEAFLAGIKFDFRGVTNARNEKLPITRSNLERLGERLKQEQPEFQLGALHTGCMNATVDDDEISELLNMPRFQNKAILVLAEEGISKLSWEGASHQTRKVLYQKCDAMFSSNEKTKRWWESHERVAEFGRAKPCLWGSDAHSVNDLFSSPGGKSLWLKADPTFRGLLQVLHEPATRCFIGTSPPAWENIRLQKKPHITRIQFQKKPNSKLQDHWFDGCTVDFNPAMVTIIGNKGAGKSALADTLALAGAAHVGSANFSFLNGERFKKKDGRTALVPAEEFSVVVSWSAGGDTTHCLGREKDGDALERVRYLPQGYLEKICNERDEHTQKMFRDELDRVIFSHVRQSERLGTTSLTELIDVKCDELFRRISAKKRHVHDLNHKIAALEAKVTPAAINALKLKIAAKENELRQLDGNKPEEMPSPFEIASSDTAHATNLELVESCNAALEKCEDDLRISMQRLASLRIHLQKAEKLHEILSKFMEHYHGIQPLIDKGFNELGIPVEGVLHADVQFAPLDEFIKRTTGEVATLDANLDVQEPGNLHAQRDTLEKQLHESQAKLDAPNQRYQRYLADLAAWNRRRSEIIGGKDVPDTLEHYRHQVELAQLDHPEELARLQDERNRFVRQIYEHIEEQAQTYRHYYSPAMKSVGKGSDILNKWKISFDVRIDGSRFAGDFLALLNKGSSGTFYGSTQAPQRLRDMCPDGTFDTADSTIRFLETIMNALLFDQRESQPRRNNLDKQLRREISTEKLYDFLFSLEYLEPRYALTFGGKNLQELSPGERGLLLLVFYLMIDKENIPLIIDQPEENLDNQSIKSVLVPCIKEAKERRQLFIVTHNPNVAVVCDSEQVIFSTIDKADGARVRYDCGSIEQGIINRHLVDVLEGTPPAFENRTAKYRAAGTLR